MQLAVQYFLVVTSCIVRCTSTSDSVMSMERNIRTIGMGQRVRTCRDVKECQRAHEGSKGHEALWNEARENTAI